jgi:hypothetical protein
LNCGTIIRRVDELRKHPAYERLQLVVSAAQLAELRRLGNLAFKDPLLITHTGIIIDGYARKVHADTLGISNLACVEFDIGEEEALRLILSKHRRSMGWNDYNRICLASQLTDGVRTRARANQQVGGHLKGLSKLTEANVRKAIAHAAGVSEGNVTKVGQLGNSDSELLKALANSEIRIHRAWLWRSLTPEEQRENLRLYHLERGLKRPVRAKALAHRVNESSGVRWVTPTKINAELILRKLSPISSIDSGGQTIRIGVLQLEGKAVLLSTELFEQLETESTI